MANMWDMVLQSGSLTIAFWIFISVVSLLIVFAIGWWIFKKFFIYKYNFTVVTHTGDLKPKKARIVRGENGVKKFEIDGHSGQLLTIQDANAIVDGKPTRMVSYDGMGNLVYTDKVEGKYCKHCAKFKVDKEEYYKTALKPIEREQIANNIIASVKKYGKMSAEVKWSLILGFILLIAVIVGNIVQGKILAKQYEIGGQNFNTAQETSKTLENTAQIIYYNTEVQKLILDRVLGESNLTLNITLPAK